MRSSKAFLLSYSTRSSNKAVWEDRNLDQWLLRLRLNLTLFKLRFTIAWARKLQLKQLAIFAESCKPNTILTKAGNQEEHSLLNISFWRGSPRAPILKTFHVQRGKMSPLMVDRTFNDFTSPVGTAQQSTRLQIPMTFCLPYFWEISG